MINLLTRLIVLSLLLAAPLFAQETPVEGQYQPLISGMENYRDGKYEKAMEEAGAIP